eukprot:361447_1
MNQLKILVFLLFWIAINGLPDGLNSWTIVTEWANTPYYSTHMMDTGYNKVQNVIWLFGGWVGPTQKSTNYIIKFNVSSKTFEYNPSKWQMPMDFYFAYSQSGATVNDIVYLSPSHYEDSNNVAGTFWNDNQPEPIYKFDMTQEQWFNVPETTIPMIGAMNRYQTCLTGEEIQNILILTGGVTKTNTYTNTWIYYNLTSHSWSLEITNPTVTVTRNNHECIIANDYLWIMGGVTPEDQAIKTIERIYIMDILNIHDYQWQLLSTTISNSRGFGITVDPTGNLYMIGGSPSVSYSVQRTDVVDMLNIRTLLVEKSLPVPQTMARNSVVTTIDNQFLIFGRTRSFVNPPSGTMSAASDGQYLYSNVLPTQPPTPYIAPDKFYNSKYVMGGFTSFDVDVTRYNFDTLLAYTYSEANTFCQNAYGTTLAIIKSSFENELADELCILYGIPCLI